MRFWALRIRPWGFEEVVGFAGLRFTGLIVVLSVQGRLGVELSSFQNSSLRVQGVGV